MKQEDKQLSLDKSYMSMAYVWAKRSYALRRKVGALIVKDRVIISDGYNGTPSGFPNVCEFVSYRDFSEGHFDTIDGVKRAQEHIKKHPYCGIEVCTEPHVLHAEANAITKLARHGGTGSEGATIYTTTQPCLDCAKLIIQAGISRVVYVEDYHNTDGLRLLEQAGVKVDRIEIEN